MRPSAISCAAWSARNESIEGSSASLAKQLRVIIRQQVVAGADNKAIMHYMVQRYGIFRFT